MTKHFLEFNVNKNINAAHIVSSDVSVRCYFLFYGGVDVKVPTDARFVKMLQSAPRTEITSNIEKDGNIYNETG